MAQLTDHYATLKIAPDADIEVVKAAYKALMLKYHPDRNQDNPAALTQATQINAAYEILGDSYKRATYDGVLANARLDRSPPMPDFASQAPPHQPFYGDGEPARGRAADRRGFRPPRLRDFLIATIIWRAASVAAALAVTAAGGLYLKHELSTTSLDSGQQFSRITQALGGLGAPDASPASPRIIHIEPGQFDGARPASPLTWLRTQLTTPHYSREVIDGVVIYRRSDPWPWLEARYRQITRGWRPAPKADRSKTP